LPILIFGDLLGIHNAIPDYPLIILRTVFQGFQRRPAPSSKPAAAIVLAVRYFSMRRAIRLQFNLVAAIVIVIDWPAAMLAFQISQCDGLKRNNLASLYISRILRRRSVLAATFGVTGLAVRQDALWRKRDPTRTADMLTPSATPGMAEHA
jgi:hypothetical protein